MDRKVINASFMTDPAPLAPKPIIRFITGKLEKISANHIAALSKRTGEIHTSFNQSGVQTDF